MDKDNLRAIAEALVDLDLSPYEAERLIAIAKAVPTSFSRARLAGIGPERLVLVLPHLTEGNALDLLQLAEQHPVDQLREIVKARQPAEARGVRLSGLALNQIGRAFETAGLVYDEGRVGRSEDALLLQIEELAALAGAARTVPVNVEKPSKVATLVLRVEGDRRWTLPDRSRLAEAIEASLRSNADALNVKLAKETGVKARVTKIDAFYRGPDLPANGQRAREMGFDRTDNPHPLGSRQHRAWDSAFQAPARSIFSIRG